MVRSEGGCKGLSEPDALGSPLKVKSEGSGATVYDASHTGLFLGPH